MKGSLELTRLVRLIVALLIDGEITGGVVDERGLGH